MNIPTATLWQSATNRLSDWIGAFILVSMGILLFVDTELLVRGAYGGMVVIAYQWTWGMAFLTAGLLRLTANGLDCFTPHPLLRTMGAFAGAFIWLDVTFAVVGTAENWGLLLAVCPWLFVQDFIAMVRAGSEL